jgi:hypothetical protein
MPLGPVGTKNFDLAGATEWRRRFFVLAEISIFRRI